LLSKLKSLFTKIFKTDNKIESEKTIYTLSKDINNISYDTYDTITQAIEATKGNKYYIHEKRGNSSLYKGCWIEYILQKEI